jgi:hypothetical protein
MVPRHYPADQVRKFVAVVCCIDDGCSQSNFCVSEPYQSASQELGSLAPVLRMGDAGRCWAASEALGESGLRRSG